ncbi:Winged helix-turn-helix DNA-binding domain [Trinorchestia longiramus]|nr:Winged helix-turn-helix DNA-binding domain [Trinorchestia longiramus]
MGRRWRYIADYTGVDWKSLTLPACLPITTDFFPSEESIQKDYVVSNYALLPTDVNEPNRGHHDKPEYGENVERKLLPPVFGRTRLTPAQTFSEIVSQRLAQGFQLILPKEETRSSARLKKHHKRKGFPVTLSQEWQGASSVRASAADIRSAVAYKAAAAAPMPRPVAAGGNSSLKQHPGCPSVPENEERRAGESSSTKMEHLHNPEYRLSIGTLFHRLTLVCNHRIDVSVYRPRIMSETLKKDYKYRFCAPYMTGYELSSTKFKTERLDRYQWNFFDNYVSFYSDNTQNSLAEHLKFWRVRLVMVPDLYRSILRQLIDNWRDFPDAGIYPPLSNDQRIAVNESFLKFFESLHRIKRQVVKKPKAQSSAGQGGTSSVSGGTLARPGANGGVRERSVSAREGPVHQGSSVGGVVVRDRVMSGGVSVASVASGGDNNESAKLTSPVTQSYSTSNSESRSRERLLVSDGTIQNDSSAVSSIAHSTVSSSSQSLQVLPTVSEDSRCLSTDSELSEIVAAMTKGMNFFSPPHPDLPPLSFLSTDVVSWFREHVRNVCSREEAMVLLQRLVSEDYVRHASGLRRVIVYYGFYIYFIVTGEHDCSPVTFYHQFHEVEMKPIDAYDSFPSSQKSTAQKDASRNDNVATPASTLPSFLRDELPPLPQPFRTSAGNLLTKGPIGTDPHHRSERNEFGDLICTSSFSCDSAYLLCLRWMCASGPIVADLISLWQRRASACNMFLFPIPSDPFALPHSLDCDPLRGPIHLPLVMCCNPPCPAAAAGLPHGPLPVEDISCPSARPKPKSRPLLGLCPKHDIFAKFPSSTRPQRTRLLQEAILAKFGFIRFQNDLSSLIAPTSSSIGSSDSNQFVHVSGNAFVMVLTPGIADAASSSGSHSSDCHTGTAGSGVAESTAAESTTAAATAGAGHSASAAPKLTSAMPKFLDPQPTPLRPSSLFIEALGGESGSSVSGAVASPHEEYFHRLMSEHHKTVAPGAAADAALCLQTSDKHRTAIPQSPGFLWSFNYMMSRRWKTAASNEEAFGELLLHDFKNFCSNKNDRLRHYVENFMTPAAAAAAANDSASSTTNNEPLFTLYINATGLLEGLQFPTASQLSLEAAQLDDDSDSCLAVQRLGWECEGIKGRYKGPSQTLALKSKSKCIEEDSGMRYLVWLDEKYFIFVDAIKNFLVHAWNKRH